MDGAPCPGLADLIDDALGIQGGGDLCFGLMVGGEEVVNAPHGS